jgi:uncharacterized protein YqeY
MFLNVKSVAEWKSALRAALGDALRTRQSHAIAVLRETLAAIDNAEAADTSAAPPVQLGVIAGGVAGLGAGEVPRLSLSVAQVNALIAREIEERRQAVSTYAALEKEEEARRLQLQIDVLTSLL